MRLSDAPALGATRLRKRTVPIYCMPIDIQNYSGFMRHLEASILKARSFFSNFSI
jgi:hypothetical protein